MNRVTIWFGNRSSTDPCHLNIRLIARNETLQEGSCVNNQLNLLIKPRHAYPVSTIDRKAVQHFIADKIPPASSVVMMAPSDSIDQAAMPFVAAAAQQIQCRCQAIILQSTLPQPSSGLTALRHTLTTAFLRAIDCPVALAAVETVR
jgi:hypothetical protein